MKRVVLGCGMLFVVVLAVVLTTRPWTGAVAQGGEQEITVRVAQGVTSPTEDAECVPFGVLDQAENRPFRQVIITSATRDIIGVLDLQTGKIYEGDCVIAGTFAIADSPFYTFSIDGTYTHTVSRADLKAGSTTFGSGSNDVIREPASARTACLRWFVR